MLTEILLYGVFYNDDQAKCRRQDVPGAGCIGLTKGAATAEAKRYTKLFPGHTFFTQTVGQISPELAK